MRILVISDFHAPFHHAGAFDFLRALQREIKPEEVVCVGDEIDGHGWGRWGRDPDAPGQGDELKQSVTALKTLYKLFPKCRVCVSNHGLRAQKTAQRAGLPSAFLKAHRDVLEAPPGWAWADHWIVGGVAFKHGDGYSGQSSALAAATKHRMNTVIGHVHAWAGVAYNANEFSTIWGMNVGCLVDPASIAMEYAKINPNHQVLGAGVVIDGVPQFRPMRS